MGYATAVLHRTYPDLSEDGDEIFVDIRNPKTVPLSRLQPDDLPLKEDGTPDMSQAMPATYKVIAGLITKWHVYDADDDTGALPELPLPATAETVGKLPAEIISDIMERIAEVMAVPQ